MTVILGLSSVLCHLSFTIRLVFQWDIYWIKRDSRFYDAGLSFTGTCIKSNFRCRLLPEQLSPFLPVPQLRRPPGIYEVIRDAKKAFLIFNQ